MAKKKKTSMKSNKTIKKAKAKITNKSTTIDLKKTPKKTIEEKFTKKPIETKSPVTKKITPKKNVEVKKTETNVHKKTTVAKKSTTVKSPEKRSVSKAEEVKKEKTPTVSAKKKTETENKATSKTKTTTSKKKTETKEKEAKVTKSTSGKSKVDKDVKEKKATPKKKIEPSSKKEVKKKQPKPPEEKEVPQEKIQKPKTQKKPYKRKFIFLDEENKEELREEEIIEETKETPSLEKTKKKIEIKKNLGDLYFKAKVFLNRQKEKYHLKRQESQKKTISKNEEIKNAKELKNSVPDRTENQFQIKKSLEKLHFKIQKIFEQLKEKNKLRKQEQKKKKEARKQQIQKVKEVKNKLQEVKTEKIMPKKKKFVIHIKHKGIILLVIFCLMLVLLTLFPYGITNYRSEASGKILDVPKFLNLTEECCNFSAKFSSFRSAWALEQEMEEIISNYEVLNCDGIKYYYNEKEDYTVTEYQVQKGFIFNRVSITYGKGNSCDIDTTFKRLELLSDNFSLDDAKKDGNYVIDGEVVYNESAYSEFLENVKNKKPNTLRIVTTTTDRDVIIIDLEYLSDGKYKVTYDGTRDRHNENHNSMEAYKYEHLGVFHNRLYAYNGESAAGDTTRSVSSYYLFSLVSK